MAQATQALLDSINLSINKIRGAYTAWAKANGVNYHELLLLYFAANHPKCTQKQICDLYLLPKQTINNVVIQLKKAGYLKIVPDAGSQREKRLELTAEGRQYAAGVLAPLLAAEKRALHQVGEAEIRQMADTASHYGALLAAEMTGDASDGTSGK